MRLASQYALGRLFAPITPRLLAGERARALLMRHTVARPGQLSSADALELARVYQRTPSFREHLAATRRTRFAGGHAITVPVAVAWGEEERLIPKRARLPGELPPRARVVNPRRLRPPGDVGRPGCRGRAHPGHELAAGGCREAGCGTAPVSRTNPHGSTGPCRNGIIR